jgi:hypothetical protein
MAAPIPHRVPLFFGDQRALFFVRGAHVVPWGRRWAPLRPPRLAVGLGGHERSDRACRPGCGARRERRRDCAVSAAAADMQAIVQDSCDAVDAWRVGYGAQGRITMSLRIIMSSRVVRFAGLRAGRVQRGAD